MILACVCDFITFTAKKQMVHVRKVCKWLDNIHSGVPGSNHSNYFSILNEARRDVVLLLKNKCVLWWQYQLLGLSFFLWTFQEGMYKIFVGLATSDFGMCFILITIKITVLTFHYPVYAECIDYTVQVCVPR